MLYFPAWKVVWVCDYDKCLWSFFRMNLLKFLIKMSALDLRLLKHVSAGLSLRAGGRGFSLAIMSMSPSYFQRKQKENRRTSLLYNSPPTIKLQIPYNPKQPSHSPVSEKFFPESPVDIYQHPDNTVTMTCALGVRINQVPLYILNTKHRTM